MAEPRKRQAGLDEKIMAANLGGVIALAVLAAQVLEDQEAVPKPPTREEIERRLKFGFGL